MDTDSPFNPPPQALAEYLQEISQSLDFGTSDEDLVEKLIKESDGWEANLCFSASCSRTVEELARHCDAFARAFLAKILSSVRHKLIFMLLRSRNGSHVFETLLKTSISSFVPLNEEITQEINHLYSELVGMLCEVWSDVCMEQGTSHVIRCLGSVLSGFVEQQGEKKPRTEQRPPTEVYWANRSALAKTKECAASFQLIAFSALNWNLMKENFFDPNATLIVQDYTKFAVAAGKGKILTALFESCCEESQKKIVIQQWKDKQGSRAWEELMRNGHEEDVERVYQCLLEGELAALSAHPFANFPVQRFLEACKTEEMIANVVDELVPEFPQIFETKNYGIISALVGAISVAGDADVQKTILKALRKVFNCRKGKKFRTQLVPRLIALCRDELFDGTLTYAAIQYHGCILAQKLLKFKLASVAKSFLSLSSEATVVLCCHPSGSHVVDAFLSSDNIEEEQKKELISKLSIDLKLLAVDKHGSRVLDSIWDRSSMKEKSDLASILIKSRQELLRVPVGRLIASKYGLELFQNNPKQWREQMAQTKKKRKIFN